MADGLQIGPDLTRCFGHYRAQSPRYALVFCVRCPRVKDCVQSAWGTGDSRRARRREARWVAPRQMNARRPAPPSGYWLAT